MDRSDIASINQLVNPEDKGSYVAAGRQVLSMVGQNGDKLNPDQGKAVLSALFYSFLYSGQYTEAALLAWGNIRFNPEPEEVQRIWKVLVNEPKAIILGASALGKTFNGVIFELLDWCRDPEYTNIKIISAAEGHALANSWATLLDFHKSAIVDLPGEPTASTLVLRPRALQSAIAIIAIPQSDDGKGRLQGFHPLPRPRPHPVFGSLSRVGAFIDEAEKVPTGLWVGIDNLLTAQTVEGSVRIIGVTNPEDISSPLAQRAEPENGWDSIDIDDDQEWTSKQGWKVIRLDAAKTRNVVEKKQVYIGLHTYEGFMSLLSLGPSHPRYFTFGRGFYPRGNIDYNIIPPGHLTHAVGMLNFVSLPENIASLDPAFADGGDEAVLTTGRYGIADGIIGGKKWTPKPCLQIEQQFPIEKKNIVHMADDIMMILRNLRVRPEWFAMDKSGNALGLYDTLRIKYGGILGISWTDGATKKKILQEDSAIAFELYKMLVTEMWFAFAKWVEYDHVWFAPIMDTHKLFAQFTGRKFYSRGLLRKTESKEEYKAHSGGKSPDYADSAIMMVHLCRIRATEKPSILPERAPKYDTDWEWFDKAKADLESDVPGFISFDD